MLKLPFNNSHQQAQLGNKPTHGQEWRFPVMFLKHDVFPDKTRRYFLILKMLCPIHTAYLSPYAYKQTLQAEKHNVSLYLLKMTH